MEIRQYSMDDNLVDKMVPEPKPAKSLMWYVGCIIAIGIVGVTAILFLTGSYF